MSAGALVDRRLVELVVAREQRGAQLRGQRDGGGVGDRVGDVDHLDLERAGLGRRARLELLELRLEPVLLELGRAIATVRRRP
jgi:hypothetical protein